MAVGRSPARRNTGGLGLAIDNAITVRPGRAASGAKQRVLQIRRNVCLCHRVDWRFFVFQSILLDRAIDLSQVVDAYVSLGGDAGTNEVGNRDRGQQERQMAATS